MTGLPIFAPGTVVAGEFAVVRPLDEGGMGAVFLVEQKSTGKMRALKVMHREIVADPVLQRRFEQEAKIGARIASDHVVDVVAAGVDATTGLPYLVMELLEGEDLRDHLDRHGAMAKERARVVFEQLCHAMAAAHAVGIVHRDLKPENVFLARSRRAGSEPLDVKVLDFGVAKLAVEAGTRATRTKGAVGSPLWMAPEQTSPGPVTPAADVWALGLIAYEVFTGKTFWRTSSETGGTTAQLLREIVLDPIPWASERAREHGRGERLPVGFDAWFARCVTREPQDRYADAGVAWRAMQPMFVEGGQGVAFAETTAAPSTDTTPPRADDTGAATPFAKALSEMPHPAAMADGALPKETPIASVRQARAGAAPRRSRSRAAIFAGIAIALVGITAGAVMARRGPEAPAPGAAIPPPPSVASAPSASSPAAVASTSAPGAGSPAATAVASTSAEPVTAPKAAAPSASPFATVAAPKSSTTSRPTAGGFADPVDRKGAVLWKVQGKNVRLFTRLVSNESNVADRVVRDAVEWNSWQYLRCYERSFGGAKDMPEGVVTVGFDILDQLPRHGKLVSSTVNVKSFDECVVGTLIGQTINAAGPEGKGHAVVAFRFVPMD
jgi:serine/threonine-protein kinase